MSGKEAIKKIKEMTIKDDFGEFVKSLNLSRDDYKTMMEYIDEILAVQSKQVCVATITLTDEQVKEVIEKAKNAVISVIEPEPHEGHWIGGDGSYICSECGGNPMDFIDTMSISFGAYIETSMNYCPHCGADMRGMKDG